MWFLYLNGPRLIPNWYRKWLQEIDPQRRDLRIGLDMPLSLSAALSSLTMRNKMLAIHSRYWNHN